jgi:3-hydroxyacyl-[acyl-carrier-protein] dehydratase
MRWFWIDRFTEFVSGDCATAIKNVSLGDDCLHDCYFDSHLAGTLVLEGLAQTGGMLVGVTTDYQARLVLGKVSRLSLYELARPGDTLRYHARIIKIGPEGALIEATSHIGDTLQAEAEFFLAILPAKVNEQLFEPSELARLLRMLRVYEVGRTADGQPLEFPERFLSAERIAAGEV